MILYDPEGHQLDLGDDLPNVDTIEVRTQCKVCRRVRCFMPRKEA